MRRYELSIILAAFLATTWPALAVPAQEATGPQGSPPQRAVMPKGDPSRRVATQGLKPLAHEAMPNTRVETGLMPPNVAENLFEKRVAGVGESRPAGWAPIQYCWYASNLRHRPLYFEEAMLERNGQTYPPLVQPFASGARFFLTFPLLPYAITVTPPRPALHALGYFRPGDRAPILLQRPPLQADAGVMEAGTWVGLIFLIP